MKLKWDKEAEEAMKKLKDGELLIAVTTIAPFVESVYKSYMGETLDKKNEEIGRRISLFFLYGSREIQKRGLEENNVKAYQ